MPKVTLYGAPTCPDCHLAKIFLDEHKVDFQDVNVSDKAKAQEMVGKTQQRTIPVIMVGDEFIVGFDKAKIKGLLRLK
ncbi:MAG: glutaredoxin family protein [Nanoarchaeota archaeon]|nr:glutaredoxin family protein [Nanoarchaeota archaeon]